MGDGRRRWLVERSHERAARKRVADAAKQEYDRLVERAKNEAGPEGFHVRRAE